MGNVRFNIREGLSQENRQFKELVGGFYAVDDSTLKDLLQTLKNVCYENGIPEILDEIDIDDLVEKVEGTADGYLNPAVSLYATCASLLLRVKKRLNTLPDKRIDFYYEKILGENPRGTQGDFAHVVFPNPVNGLSCDLPAGTKFLAGTDEDGKEIEFKSVKDACINDASVKKIMTLAMNGELSQRKMDEKNDADAILPPTCTEIPVYSPKLAFDGENMTPYPLFGLTRSGQRSVNSRDARLGVAFASPILALKEGLREIKTTFSFDEESVKGTLLKSGSCADKFLKTFSRAFKISLTTEEGWYKVDGYQLEAHVLNPEIAENCFCLTFTLPEIAPSIVNYSSRIHGDLFETAYPVMKIEVNSQSSYNPWKHLRLLKLLKIRAEVNVHGLRSFKVFNDIGELSLETAIQPFGPMPNVGNTFSMSSEEFCGKKLTSLAVYGVWRGIPNKNDFSEWYSLYPNIPHTNDFRVSVFSVGNGSQIPLPSQRPIVSNLFKTVDSKISKEFHVSFDGVLGVNTPETQYKIRLVSPENAFMHKDYSQALCNTLMGQALKKVFSGPIPNQPYTPEVENVYVDYSAKCEINTRRMGTLENSGKIFFLRPWGFSSVSPLTESGGALFIGISCSEIPKSVNLFFHLKRDSDYTVSDDLGDFSWSVLCGENWVNLPLENILYNSTAGFTTSGIVSVILPKDATRGGKLMPGDLIWIRLRPLGDWRHCCRIYSVYAQALEVVRCVEKNTFKKLTPVNPGTITELSRSREGLSEVCQITKSFGGKAPEDNAKMRTRVAEFLYHRGRALTPRDYERLVLEAFPEVHMVKCFPGLNPENAKELMPGYLTIVPVSAFVETKNNSWDPCLGGMVLSEIKNFLKDKIPSSAKIRVINPFFEKMQVRCNVDFWDDRNEGESLQDLNNKINQFISPWSKMGNAKFFGWTLDEKELKNFILNLKYVKSIKNLSVMRIASSDSCNFSVDNTEQMNSGVLRGLCPWSVPVPMPKHYLNIVQEIEQSRLVSVGYGDLEIGSTFIIGCRRRNDEVK